MTEWVMGSMLDRHMRRADAFLAFSGSRQIAPNGNEMFRSANGFVSSDHRRAVNDAECLEVKITIIWTVNSGELNVFWYFITLLNYSGCLFRVYFNKRSRLFVIEVSNHSSNEDLLVDIERNDELSQQFPVIILGLQSQVYRCNIGHRSKSQRGSSDSFRG